MEKFIKFIEKYQDKDWDWEGISHNENLTRAMLNQYPDKPWDWTYIRRWNHKILDIEEQEDY